MNIAATRAPVFVGIPSLRLARACLLPWLPLIGLLLVLLPPVASGWEGFSAFVNTTALNLRAEPGVGSPILGILLKYDSVTVMEDAFVGRTRWFAIEAAGGYTNGWVAARYIELGEPPAIGPQAVDYGIEETPTLVKGRFRYLGAAGCRECHTDPTGHQTRGASVVWERHVHASAFETLKREYSRQIAKRTRGVEKPGSDWRCLKCHVTAYGADPSQLAPGYRNEDGVGCEACHGPGGEYAEADHGPDNPERAAMGFVILNELDTREELCTRCHQPASPTYKVFNLREYSRAIAHWPEPEDKVYYAYSQRAVERREEAIRRLHEASEKKRREETLGLSEEEAQLAEQRAREEEAERAEAERRRLQREAEAALARKHETERQEAAARKEAAHQAKQAASKLTGVERHLEDLPDVMTLNTEGEKYRSVEFSHAAHASGGYLPGGDCITCHHDHEGDDAPEGCPECHLPGGDAEEKNAKSRATHSKQFPYPKEPGRPQVSCMGCHKSQNELLELGKRQGETAPIKCAACHKKK